MSDCTFLLVTSSTLMLTVVDTPGP